MLDWYARKIPHLLNEFKTDLERGLNHDEAKARLLKYGSNEIHLSRETSLPLLFVKQILSIPVLLLAVTVCVLVYPLDQINSALVVSAILCFHVLWQFTQNIRTRYQLQAIEHHLGIRVSVVRDEIVTEISPTEIVPGDLILLNEGDYITADARLVEGDRLVVDEISLFGTSMSVQKMTEDIFDAGIPPSRQRNMVFAGTYVIEGEGRAIVVATGKKREIHNPNYRVPAQLDLDPEAEMQMGIYYDYFKVIGLLLGVSAAVIALWLQRQDALVNWQDLLFLGLGFAIAAIPGSVASTARAILAENAYRLLQKGIAIQSLINLERLSGITALCVDEIGVFTKDTMAASHAFVDEQLIEKEAWEASLKPQDGLSTEVGEIAFSDQSLVPSGFPLLILAASQCTMDRQNQQRNTTEKYIDDAIQQLAKKIGFDPKHYDAALSLIYELPRASQRPYKVLIFETETGEFLQLMFGKVEAVLDTCQYVQMRGKTGDMRADQKRLSQQVNQYLLDNDAQVFGVAYRNLATLPSQHEIKQNLTFLGMLAFAQAHYKDAKKEVEFCVDAGIKIVMITDKDKLQAFDLAREFGLIQDKKAVVSRAELDQLNNEELDSIADRLLVYCKPSPEQKLNIVQRLKRSGYSVGIWGKSPGDLRAIKVADVSFASASRASHIVQQHSGCLILQDGFEVISDLLLHAREMYSNLRNSMRWLLSCTVAQLITLVIGFIIQQLKGYPYPMPLNLQQIIWVYFLVNLIPANSLGYDRIRGDLKRNRRKKVPPFLPKIYRFDILLRSIVVALMTIVSFVVTLEFYPNSPQRAQTAACTTLVLTQLIASFQCHRHFWESLYQRITANISLFITVLICIALHLLVIYLPDMRQILWGSEFYQMEPLLKEWQLLLPFCIFLLLFPLNLGGRRANL